MPQQISWFLCSKCQGLSFAGNALCVPGVHDHSTPGGLNFVLATSPTGGSEQDKWKGCSKCQELSYTGGQLGGCPAGGQHDVTKSADYYLSLNNPEAPGEKNWK